MKPITIVLCLFSVAGYAQDNAAILPEADAFYQSALRLYDQSSYQGAISQLDFAIAETKAPEYYKLRGDCFQRLGQFESAHADYNFALRRNVVDSTLFLNRAACRINMELFEEAVADLHKFLESQPESPRAFYYLAVVEYYNFSYKGAINYLELATNLNPDYMEAYYLLGAVYGEMGKPDLALENYGTAYELDPTFHRSMLNAAVLKMEFNDPDGALEILETLKDEQHDFGPELHYYLGEVKTMLHDKDGACEEWQTASAIGDLEAKINYDRICLGAKGEKVEKRQRLTKVSL
jgi:tetratricopeptide (TPR) repeat protein